MSVRPSRALMVAGALAALAAMPAAGGEAIPVREPAPSSKMPKSARGSGYRHGSTHTSTCDWRLKLRRTKNKLAKKSRRRNRHG